MTLQCNSPTIPKHRHTGVHSTFTFILTFGKDINDSTFIIGDENIPFPKNGFFALHFNGESLSHEVQKKDKNTYIYFIFDLLIAAPVETKFIKLPLLN